MAFNGALYLAPNTQTCLFLRSGSVAFCAVATPWQPGARAPPAPAPPPLPSTAASAGLGDGNVSRAPTQLAPIAIQLRPCCAEIRHHGTLIDMALENVQWNPITVH